MGRRGRPGVTPTRATVLAGMAGGGAWTVLLVGVGLRLDVGQGLTLAEAMAWALAPSGLVMALVVARLAALRFRDDALIDGDPFPRGGGAEIDQRVLTNTVEQVALAVALWPLAGLAWGNGLVLALGAGLGVTRLLFWAGYHRAPSLRAFGFAGGFYPTLLAAALALAGLAWQEG